MEDMELSIDPIRLIIFMENMAPVIAMILKTILTQQIHYKIIDYGNTQ